MKLCPTMLLFAVAALPLSANAGALCTAQGEALLKRIAEDVAPPPSAAQLEQIRAIAAELCEAQTAQTGEMAPPPGFSDWFTYFMFTKQPDKAGNKRLRNLK